MIIGILGEIGAGKTHIQIKYALEYADKRNKQIVTNYPLNIEALAKYCSLPRVVDLPFGSIIYEILKLIQVFKISINNMLVGILPNMRYKKYRFKFKPRHPWILYLCRKGFGISEISGGINLPALMLSDAVVLLDEAGIFLNSRDFKNTSKQLLYDLAQSRKSGTDLFWTAQYCDQVDRFLRELTQLYYHCEGTTIFSKKLKRPRMILKRVYWFKAGIYYQWLSNIQHRNNYFKTKFAYAVNVEEGSLSVADKLIFDIYTSFSRLESLRECKINTIHQCVLPKDYFINNKNYDIDFKIGEVEVKSKDKKIVNFVSNSNNKINLIGTAIKLAKKNGIKNLPYFKSMSISEIELWISNNINCS